MMPDDTPDFIPHEGVSPEMRAIMRRSAATPFPGEVPDFIPHQMAPPPVSQAPAVLRFLMGAGKTAAAGTLNAGPQQGILQPVTPQQSQQAAQRGPLQTLKDALGDSSIGNFFSNTASDVAQPVKQAAADIKKDPAEGSGSAMMQLLMLYKGIKQVKSGAPEGGSPNAYAEQVQPLSGYKPAAPDNPYAASSAYKPMSGMPKYPAPEMPTAASPSEVRAASSPSPPRSSLSKNQQQLADFRAKQQPAAAAEPVYDRSAPKAPRTDLPASQAPTPELMKQMAEHDTIPAIRKQIRDAKASGDTAAVSKWTKELQDTANKYGLQHRIASEESVPMYDRRGGDASIQKASNVNSQADVATFQEQASQELFGKSFKDLPVNDPAARLQATLHAVKLQNLARKK